MNKSDAQDERIARMSFASVYPMYVQKVEKKGRSKEELHRVIEWLTGFDARKLRELIEKKVTFDALFQHASLNPNVHLITGTICGYRVQEIENPLTRKVRYLGQTGGRIGKGPADGEDPAQTKAVAVYCRHTERQRGAPESMTPEAASKLLATLGGESRPRLKRPPCARADGRFDAER